MKAEPQIGDRVKVEVTNLVGILTAKSQHLYGCERVGVQPEGTDKDNKPYDTYWFDITAVKVVKKKVLTGDTDKPLEKKTGGPSLPGQTPTRNNPK